MLGSLGLGVPVFYDGGDIPPDAKPRGLIRCAAAGRVRHSIAHVFTTFVVCNFEQTQEVLLHSSALDRASFPVQLTTRIELVHCDNFRHPPSAKRSQ